MTYWGVIKAIFVSSIKEGQERKELRISQNQAIINLMEKIDREKRQIKNWRTILLLNVDTKILFIALSKKLKEVLPCLIFTQQTAYVQKRSIGESGRLIFDNIEITNTQQMEGFLVTMDVDKAFDSLDHNFLISVLKKIGFCQKLSKIYLVDRNNFENQESCVINGETTTKYFKLNSPVGSRHCSDICWIYIAI